MVRTAKREKIAAMKEYLMELKTKWFKGNKAVEVAEKLPIEMDGHNQEIMRNAALEFMTQPQDEIDPALLNEYPEFEIKGTDWDAVMKKFEEAKVDHRNFDDNPDEYIKNNKLDEVQMDIDVDLSQEEGDLHV